ncbi:MAG: MgtC/SapB family protein [Phycisphaerae bacterium]
MPLHPDLPDLCWRIALTLLAGILIGLNRSEHGKPAGIRTVMLVALASCFAMILANLLMTTTGKDASSFVQLDTMRLPLGVLTGMGFIGAGTILRRGNLIVGVTTAATLWYVTILGFCFGAGQFALGGVSLLLGLAILWIVRQLEEFFPQRQRATVTLTTTLDGPSDGELRRLVQDSKYEIDSWAVAYSYARANRKIKCVVTWPALPSDTSVPPFVEKLRETPGIQKLQWVPSASTK